LSTGGLHKDIERGGLDKQEGEVISGSSEALKVSDVQCNLRAFICLMLP